MDRFLVEKLESALGGRSEFDSYLIEASNLQNSVLVSFVNPFSYGLVLDEKILDSVDRWFVDGALLCTLSNFFRPPFSKIDRVSFDFSSIADNVFEFCVTHKLSVGFIGGKEEEVVLAKNYISKRFPGIDISFVRHGYNLDRDENLITEALERAGCKVVILGLGTPIQEKFGAFLKGRLQSSLIFTCGGFISQTASSGDYYSPFVKSLGLRWVQRALLHSHVRKRLVVDYPRFVIRYLKSMVSIKVKS